MKSALLLATLSLVGSLAMAQTPAAPAQGFIGLDEAKALVSGKKVTFMRTSGGSQAKVRWDLRDNGQLYGNNMTQNSSDSGKWKFNEQGAICTEWRGNSVNTCYGIRKNGDKFQLISPVSSADVLSIE